MFLFLGGPSERTSLQAQITHGERPQWRGERKRRGPAPRPPDPAPRRPHAARLFGAQRGRTREPREERGGRHTAGEPRRTHRRTLGRRHFESLCKAGVGTPTSLCAADTTSSGPTSGPALAARLRPRAPRWGSALGPGSGRASGVLGPGALVRRLRYVGARLPPHELQGHRTHLRAARACAPDPQPPPSGSWEAPDAVGPALHPIHPPSLVVAASCPPACCLRLLLPHRSVSTPHREMAPDKVV